MIMASERDVAVGEFIRMLQDAPPLGLVGDTVPLTSGRSAPTLSVSAAMAELDALSSRIKGLMVTAGG